MGNKPFNIAVAVDEASPCRAGQILSGKVFFDVRKAQDVTQFTSVNLQILGFESSEMGTTRENDKCTANLLQVDFARLVRLSNTAKGQYEFPFQWPIPPTLPGAIKCSDIRNKKSFCEIRYTLTAYLATSGAAVVPENSQLVSTVTLPIQGASPTTRPGPQTMPTEFFSMDSFCLPLLCGQSSMEVGWKVDKPIASPGQEVVVQCWCDNQSKRDVDHVTAKWVESISWRSGPNLSYAKSTTRNLAQQRLLVTANAQWQPALFPGRGNKRGGNNTSGGMMAAEPLTFTLQLPEDAVDTYSGQLLQVRHLLVLSVHIPGFQTSSPELACPVTVVRPYQVENSTVPQACDHENLPVAQGLALPDNWNAVASEVVTIPEATAVVVLTDHCVAPTDYSAKTDIVSSNNVTSPAPAVAGAMASAPDEALLYDSGECFSGEPDLHRLRDMAVDCPSKIPEALNKDSRWTVLVRDFTPREYSSFVLLARNHGPSVARSLAVCMGVKFECRHILACLWSLPDSNRMKVLKEVAPLASDLTDGRSSVEKELDATELAEFCAFFPIAQTANAKSMKKTNAKSMKKSMYSVSIF
jgi:Arrestin (or S-antigen), C-terminal domain